MGFQKIAPNCVGATEAISTWVGMSLLSPRSPNAFLCEHQYAKNYIFEPFHKARRTKPGSPIVFKTKRILGFFYLKKKILIEQRSFHSSGPTYLLS